MAIQSFGNAAAERIAERRRLPALHPDIQKIAQRKVTLLEFAKSLDDLRIPPGNRLEKLRGDREGQHSIRVNDQWRLCFRWTTNGPADVEFVDYHERGTVMTDLLLPTTPGEILAEEFLVPLGITQYKLARDIGVPRSRIAEIVNGTHAVSADTALRLSRYFGLRDQYWLDAQAHYDLETARDALAEGTLDAIVPVQREAG